uniref:Pepsinogen, putative n=1 Tax=Theileria parva TaxID=5875 RepID=Q4N7X8_THEPA|eukprot:XP_766213.1 pepsinogen [Theileria parva strain Muguga]
MRCGIALLLIFNSVYSLPNCSEINTIKPCIYNGPKQKRIFPLKSLSPNSVERSAEITEENWNNVTRGHIHFLYRSQGPYGSLGTSQHNSHNCNSYHTHNSVNTDDSVNSVNSVDGTRLTPIREHPMKKCIPIPHLRHVQYVMSIGVGTPKQEIYPIIDTGSTNTWVISEQCNSITCSGVPTFNSRKSSTFSPVNEGLRIRFGTGTIKGVLGIDNVTIGQDTIEKQIFGLVNEESSNVFKVIKFQGIIGLGFPKLAFDHHTSLYDNYSKQINADLIFSLYFSNQYSYVMIGGVDERFYVGDLYMLPVVREYYWEIKLYELWVGNVKLCCDDESYVIFDSGTSFNTMPHDQFLYFKHIVSPKICHVTAAEMSSEKIYFS